MRASLCLVAAGLSLLVVPAVVTAADEPAAKTKTQSKDDPNRVICRRMEDTGRLAGGRRVCHTKADWDLLAERAQRDSMSGRMTGGTSGK